MNIEMNLGDSLDLSSHSEAFFGKGRRTGKYGTLLLLATYNDDDRYVFPSICKVGTGFTDENLDQFYQILNLIKYTLKKNPTNKKWNGSWGMVWTRT